MTIINESVLINRSCDEIFSFISNYENDPVWRAGIFEMRHDPPGKTHLGMRTHEVMSLMGRKITNVAEIVEFKEGHKIAFNVISGPLSAKGHRLVDKIEDQARFTYYVQAKLDGWINVFSPIVAWVFRRQVVSDLKRLKQILETSTV